MEEPVLQTIERDVAYSTISSPQMTPLTTLSFTQTEVQDRPVPQNAVQSGGLERLWERWTTFRETEVRNELASAYFPLVKHVARTMAVTLSDQVELDDLVGFGAEGLLNAIERFDLSRGVQFSTFAAYRIRGAIYDGIRRIDWVPRSIRRRERELRENFSWLCTEFGREPTEQEESDLLGLTLDAFRILKAQLFRSGVSTLRDETDGGEARENESPRPSPLDLYVSGEELGALNAAVGELTERELSVIQLSFQEDKTLAEIGRLLGVTESRVCQVRAAALQKLRRRLEARGMVTI